MMIALIDCVKYACGLNVWTRRPLVASAQRRRSREVGKSARVLRWRVSANPDSTVSPVSASSVQPCSLWGHVRVMDYQCIVVYTVINIAPPRLTAQAAEFSTGCITWFKDKIKRSVLIWKLKLKITGPVWVRLAHVGFRNFSVSICSYG